MRPGRATNALPRRARCGEARGLSREPFARTVFPIAEPTGSRGPAVSAPDAAGEPAWDQVIRADRRFFEIPWRELWQYRDLVWMLAQRDVSSSYKQTVLGPFWFILQPLLITAVFSYLFGRMGNLGTSDVPHYLFYMSGLVLWTFFSETVTKASSVFIANANLFNKVWFPRLCVPLSHVLTNLLPLLVQLGLFLAGMAFYLIKADRHIHPNWLIVLTPLLCVQLAAFGLGLGLIVSAWTRRFRDLAFGVKVGLQLWMFGSAIVFPISRIADPRDQNALFSEPRRPADRSVPLRFLRRLARPAVAPRRQRRRESDCALSRHRLV